MQSINTTALHLCNSTTAGHGEERLQKDQPVAKRVAASAVTLGALKSVFDEASEEEPPKALTIAEIEEITERYISGARESGRGRI